MNKLTSSARWWSLQYWLISHVVTLCHSSPPPIPVKLLKNVKLRQIYMLNWRLHNVHFVYFVHVILFYIMWERKPIIIENCKLCCMFVTDSWARLLTWIFISQVLVCFLFVTFCSFDMYQTPVLSMCNRHIAASIVLRIMSYINTGWRIVMPMCMLCTHQILYKLVYSFATSL